MKLKGGHSATNSNDGDTYMNYSKRNWCSFPYLNIHLGSGFLIVPVPIGAEEKNWREGQGGGEAVCTLTGMVKMCEFPLCQAHSRESNWFLAIFVGTKLGGLMTMEGAFTQEWKLRSSE